MRSRRITDIDADTEIASHVELPPGQWRTVLDFLCERFPAIDENSWRSRLQRGRVTDGAGQVIGVDQAYRSGLRLRYYRELAVETPIPFEASILHRDAHLLVVDKPHFLPVTPSGRYVRECLLARLRRQLGLSGLVPLHRIDRETAGLVLFSLNPQTRGRYQGLFAQRQIHKIYEAIAPTLARQTFPQIYRSRLERGEPFFCTREVAGEANSETHIALLDVRQERSRYRLQPVTGRKHQLRVHMAALGAPIVNDPLYPQLTVRAEDDFSQPLQLLAKTLEFTDPLDGALRRFESGLRL
ncbi:MAG: RluA family pseudouridine synthase [Panacagrimonas sp.]